MSSGLSDEQLDDPSVWFREHYRAVPSQINEFFESVGLTLDGQQIADVGSGDGIVDLGLVHLARPARLVGFDVRATDPAVLLARARVAGVADRLPEELSFRSCTDLQLPAEDATFDRVVSWSTFEHVSDPVATASEIRRILRPDGVLFLQLYPFYHSAHGSHLWTWFPEGFEQLRRTPGDIEAAVRGSPEVASADWTEARLEDFHSLNRITVDGLQGALEEGGLQIRLVELMTHRFFLPPDVGRHRVLDLAIDGIKLLAIRA
jgi:SAM-dependent methyltransferase